MTLGSVRVGRQDWSMAAEAEMFSVIAQRAGAAGARRRGERLPSLLAYGLNVTLRLMIGFFAAEANARRGDPRFEGKGIDVRNFVLLGAALTVVVPLVQLTGRRWSRYPVWLDNLFMSILWVDMAFNSLDLYRRPGRFDLIPHAYGPAAGVVLLRALGVSPDRTVAAVTAAHVGLELQEALGDHCFGTHNVHGAWDTASDLLAGAAGTLVGSWVSASRGDGRTPLSASRWSQRLPDG